uniref:Protein kinase domain-containing protein n=1 Tax=Oryza punctata TaxID=4537 RepID=A0A0E0M078_ORYPU
MSRFQQVSMAVLLLFAALLSAALQAVGQSPGGFLSIDCGREANYSEYTDPKTGIVYLPDGQYVDSGENHRISNEKAKTKSTDLQTVRSFPSGLRNCYTLPTRKGSKYLVRLTFVYGNYDGEDSASTLKFDLHLGAYFWTTVDTPSDHVYEAMFVAWARWTPVCLINTDSGTPFANTVELRPLGDALYPTVMANQSMSMHRRCSLGETKTYPDDPYDRYWWQMCYSNPTWKNISSVLTVKEDSNFAVPSPIMQTAIEAADNNTILNITWVNKMLSGHNVKLLLHFADFQNSQLRQFNASLNNVQPYQYSPPYLTADALFNSGWSTASDGQYNIRLEPTSVSKLPPMINALEIYTLISHDSPTTFPADFETIMAIKLEYGIKKNWMGDPCFPVKFAWEAHGDVLHKVENRQFTFNELEKFTNRFERLIGQGGFGPVYFGRLEDNAEVAVKMRSESSSHGTTEFFAEVQSLTKVHHRNLVSLVGYCCERDHLALVYEYMAGGSLCDHLRDNNGVGETLNWRTRIRVVIEAAQGLDYLHKGCSLPIIHRDVKTSNILLGQNLHAKIADFGLSKTYLSETQTHISVTAAGTAGYIDPEYYQTGRLTESSDVYSFGIVLLEIATGESPILPGQGHIVQRVKRKIDAGDIRLVADERLRGAYEVSSMWKVVDTALLCTVDVGARRPTMATVVAQLKESLALEEAHENSGLRGSIGTTSDTSISTSMFGPSAR